MATKKVDEKEEQPGSDDASNEAPVAEKKKKKKVKKENNKALDAAKQKIAELEAKIGKKDDELKSENDKYLRLLAEFENFKRRNNQEKLDLRQKANESLFCEFLTILDSFDHAFANVKEEEKQDEVYKGLELIYKQVETFVSKHKLEKIDSVGKEFDPNFHNAMMQQESDDHEPGVIIQEVQKGYLYHDKVLRPTMAIISK